MKRAQILEELKIKSNSIDEKLEDISNFLDNLSRENREKSYLKNGFPTDLGYTLAYLDEIEFTSKCFKEILDMMNDMIQYEKVYIPLVGCKLWFFTVRFIGDNYQKQLSERLRNIGAKININANINTSKDMHDISNRYNYFSSNGDDITQEYIVEYTFYLVDNYIILLDKFLEVIQKNNLSNLKKILLKEKKINVKGKIIKKKSIINKLKSEGQKLEKDIDKVEKILKPSNFITLDELNKQLEKLEEKFMNLKDSKKIKELDRIKLIGDSIYRIYEAMHLLDIDYRMQKTAKMLGLYTKLLFKYNVIINHSILLISSCYDKLAKELLGNITGRGIYFSTIESQDKLRRCYQDKFDFVEINKFREKIFELRNEFIHTGVPYRMYINESFMEQVTIYQVNLIIINVSYLITIIDSIIENIK